nr:hypothetical protein Hi04_10k_c2441B_00018 [uncultured bacterium]
MAERGEDDVRRAETALHELALVLRRVPVGEHTRELHLGGLRVKRDVERWHTLMPAAQERRAVLEELERLKRTAMVLDRAAALLLHAADRRAERTT